MKDRDEIIAIFISIFLIGGWILWLYTLDPIEFWISLFFIFLTALKVIHYWRNR